MSPTSSIVFVFSGRCGKATVGLSVLKSIVYSSSYSASASASYFVYGLSECSLIYSSVSSSTGKMPFLAPASIAILAMVNLSSMVRFLIPSPTNSIDL